MIFDKLYELKSFQRQYQAVLRISASEAIENLEWNIVKADLTKIIDWNNLLGIVSVLSQSDSSDHLDAALRIAQTCLSEETVIEQKKASAVILETLTNKPALALAVQRGLIEAGYNSDIPLTLQLETCKINFENSITIQHKVLPLNKFQKKVYATSIANSTLSISAPTSAGKSFVLSQRLAQQQP